MTQTELFFPMKDVLRIVEHAKNATEHVPSYCQKYDENFNEIENLIVPPGLLWVKDEGIYLMSNGATPKGVSREKEGLVVYAMGFNPKSDVDVWDNSRHAVGGDDFVEVVQLDWFETLFSDSPKLMNQESTYGYFMLTVSQTEFGYGWAPEAR